MTRWARKGPANKKKPLPATEWEEMVNELPSSKKNRKENDSVDRTETDKSGTHTKVKKSESKSEEKSQENKLKNNKKRKLTADEHDTSPAGEADEKKAKSSSSSFGKLNMFGTDLATALEKQEKGKLEVDEDKEEETQLEIVVKNSKRSEMRRLKRINKCQNEKVCFNCRKPGHDLASCPDVEKLEHGTDICFRCGSGEHKVSQCKSKKVPQGKFPFANCFICGEAGHLSRSCPENRNGVYPNGGCCLVCGSIYHFKRDCPEFQKNKGANLISLKTIDSCQSLDEDPTVQKTRKMEKEVTQKRRMKVVKF